MHPMAAIWDDGTTSSSDGQYFRAGGRAGAGGSVNTKDGIDPGAVLRTHDGLHPIMLTKPICASFMGTVSTGRVMATLHPWPIDKEETAPAPRSARE
jgi:hypothetical protein